MDIWTMEQEAENLRSRFKGVNRAAFARENNFPGGQAMIYQHLTGRRPISMEAARIYANAFGCGIEKISPRLAVEAEGIFKRINGLKQLLKSEEERRQGLIDSVDNAIDALPAKELGGQSKLPPYDELEEAPTPIGRQRWLPVVGVVQAGPDGLLNIDDYPVGSGDGEVPYWAKCDSAYALKVRGESMSPRYLPGEFVAVDPCSEVQPSDECIVLKKDGTRMIKRLLWMRDGFATFESINQDYKNITLELEEIEALHIVLGRVPRAAFRPRTQST
jgi:phage repressor protein C with HTH and peptisase S24 domain